MQEEILNYIIEQWKSDFIGVSSLDISNRLNISHKKTLEYFEELQFKGLVTINKGKTVFEIKDFSPLKFKKRIVSFIFPSKKFLEEYFFKNIKEFDNNGYYFNLMFKGEKRLELYFFDLEVLKKYSENLEKFNITDDVCGGNITLSSSYLDSISELEDDDNLYYFDKIIYGKKKLNNGFTCVSVLISYLYNLPKSEQNYWNSFEIESPKFSNDYDDNFQIFLNRTFNGEWVFGDDPKENIISKIKSINSLFLDIDNIDNKFFKKDSNIYFKYPLINTKKNFLEANKELFKLIGNDNLNPSLLKEILIKKFNFTNEDFFDKKAKRALSPMLLLKNILRENYQIVNDYWDIVKKNRNVEAHQVLKPEITDENYIFKFQNICKKIEISLSIIENTLLKIFNNKEINNKFVENFKKKINTILMAQDIQLEKFILSQSTLIINSVNDCCELNEPNSFGWFNSFGVEPLEITDDGFIVLIDVREICFNDENGWIDITELKNKEKFINWKKSNFIRKGKISYLNIIDYNLNKSDLRPWFYFIYNKENGPFTDIKYFIENKEKKSITLDYKNRIDPTKYV